jgi:hypothetical protein
VTKGEVLVALPANALEKSSYLRLLLMGQPKVGKTASVVSTAPGPVRVLLCEDDSALLFARELTDKFDFDRIKGWNSMQQALTEAKKDAADGKVKTVVVDPLSDFAYRLEEECLEMSNTSGKGPDGRRAYPEYNKRLRHVIERLFMMPCHVVVITHFIETGGEATEDQTSKTGEGIVPLLAGKARALVAAKFADVVWMEMRKNERIFVTGPEGRWGPGCRNIDGTKILPADIGALLKAFKNRGKDLRAPGDTSANGASNQRQQVPTPVRREVRR